MTKQCLDVQQMQHLQELGMDTSNASAFWCNPDSHGDWSLEFTDSCGGEIPQSNEYDEFHPAYTLQNVLDALPKDISKDGCTWSASLYIDFENNRIAYGNTDRYGFEVYHKIMIEKDLIDAAYEMLCWCIEQGYVKTGKEDKQ